MKIATWNVNSIRARAERVATWLVDNDIDVLAVQETKCKEEQFPLELFTEAGYEVESFGYHQWNGVAIISRVGIDNVRRGFIGQPEFGDPSRLEARAIAAVCGGVDIWSLYVPHGRDLTHEHYTYKLQWLSELKNQASRWIAEDPTAQIGLLGDWNVVPFDTDVWDVAAFDGQTHVSPPEREAFFSFEAAGYEEVSRRFLPDDHTYTYWDYQKLRFPKNEGMRIDFAYCSQALAERVVDVKIDREARKGKGASDHVPVVLTLDS